MGSYEESYRLIDSRNDEASSKMTCLELLPLGFSWRLSKHSTVWVKPHSTQRRMSAATSASLPHSAIFYPLSQERTVYRSLADLYVMNIPDTQSSTLSILTREAPSVIPLGVKFRCGLL
jgi:hypothetical protein